ncbi:pilus assembly protein CpaD [Chakrabartia godavariana]|nr:pilus assembly protein CpaD [Chakrabartia godavariana]
MKTARNTLLLGIALALSACGTENRGLSSVHQPVVQRTDYVYDVAGAGGLEQTDVKRLAGWFEALKIGYGDRVSVDTSSAGDTRAARDAVAALAARYGLLLDETAPVTSGEIAPGNVRVVVSRVTASVPNCPDWSRASQPDMTGHASSNYGCATNSNLAAMIANPEDLISGRSGGPVSSTLASSKAVKTYREAPTTGAGGLVKEGGKN